MVLIQIGSLYLVDLANTQNARNLVGDALQTASISFNNQITIRNRALIHAGQLLSGDFAFKTAYASGMPRTVQSALNNHRQRSGADLMLLVSLQGKSIAVSGSDADLLAMPGSNFPFPAFISEAENTGKASGIVELNDKLYSIIAVPLLTPVPTAWIVLGFEIDNKFIDELQKDSHADISLLSLKNSIWASPVSTLATAIQKELHTKLAKDSWAMDTAVDITLHGTPYISFMIQLPSWGDTSVYAFLQRSRDEAMAPYYRLRLLLVVLFIFALLVTFFGGGAIANSVTHPIRLLAKFASQIQRGNYLEEVNIRQKDELGHLATAFNDMSKGLYERDKVRNLLGKVISPEIAEELMQKDVQLGGEERELTILFTDLRNFTGLSEKRQPSEVLDFLNEYLTDMTAVIDQHGGVVDKYIGDAIMALFGAPIIQQDHAGRAVACAMQMNEELEHLNTGFKKDGWPELKMGIGINTGTVVVGNMGSKDRLNYTAIGDAVNLAARLESVTKDYHVPIIVSESTKNMAADFHFEKLDHIQVKGKQEAVTIYTPLSSR